MADVNETGSGPERSRKSIWLRKSDSPAGLAVVVVVAALKVVRVDVGTGKVWLPGRGDELGPGLSGSRGGNESASAALSSNGSGRRET